MKVGFLERLQRRRASSRIEGRTPGFPQVVAGNLGFLSSYDGDLRDLLVGHQEGQVSMPIPSSLSGFLSIR